MLNSKRNFWGFFKTVFAIERTARSFWRIFWEKTAMYKILTFFWNILDINIITCF